MMKKQEFRGIFGGFRRFSGTRILRTNASVPKIAEIAMANWSGKPARKSKPAGTRHKSDIQ